MKTFLLFSVLVFSVLNGGIARASCLGKNEKAPDFIDLYASDDLSCKIGWDLQVRMYRGGRVVLCDNAPKMCAANQLKVCHRNIKFIKAEGRIRYNSPLTGIMDGVDDSLRCN